MHPVNDIRGSKSSFLKDKKIVLAVTGSIAAVETIKLARELIRHGAEVIPVMTNAATKIIHPDSLWFATGKRPIVELSGDTEHVNYCGRVKDPVDLLLLCPCTANTISKIAHGIDDTVVTTFATTAIGSKIPVLVVPAMHGSMYDHKIVQENIQKCIQIDIDFVGPTILGNKAKLPSIEEITANVIRKLGKNDYKDKKILVIGGGTFEAIDDVRGITNKSSGKTAISFTKNIFNRGGKVELWYGSLDEKPPIYVKTKSFTSLNDLFKLSEKNKLKKFDIIIICAALSDYIPNYTKGKISSAEEKINISLKQSQKFISTIRKKAPKSKIIAFKLLEDGKKVKTQSKNLLEKNKLDLVVGNTTSGFGSDSNKYWVFSKTKSSIKKGKKEMLTNYVLDEILKTKCLNE